MGDGDGDGDGGIGAIAMARTSSNAPIRATALTYDFSRSTTEKWKEPFMFGDTKQYVPHDRLGDFQKSDSEGAPLDQLVAEYNTRIHNKSALSYLTLRGAIGCGKTRLAFGTCDLRLGSPFSL